MPMHETPVEDQFAVPNRGLIVAVLPIDASWPPAGGLGMDIDLWVGPDLTLPMRFVSFSTICPIEGPCRSGIGLAPRPSSGYELKDITRLLKSSPNAELRLRQTSISTRGDRSIG